MNQFWGMQGDHLADDALVCVAYDKWHQVGYAAGHTEDISSLGILSSATTTSTTAALPIASFGDNDILLLKFDDNAQILWALAIGGTKDDFAFDLTTDNEGNVYLVGSYMYDFNFVSLNNPTSTYFADDGGGNSTSQGFVCSYDSNGQFRWASSEGSNGDDALHAVTNTSDGIAVIGHITQIPGTYPDPLSNTLGSVNTDVYVKKFTHDGSPLWQMAGGSDLDDYEYDEEFNMKKWDIASYSDTLYFGATYSGLTFNFYASTNYPAANQNLSLLKLSTDPDYVMGAITGGGEIIWLNHQLNNSGEQNNVSLAVDCNGLFIAGVAEDWLIWEGLSPGLKLTTGGDDMFIAKYYRATGQPKSYRMLQTPNADVDEILDIELDGLGNLMATGKHQGSITTGGPLITGATSGASFILMYNTSLTYQAHSTINATGSNEMGYDLAITDDSDVYLVGTSNGNLDADQTLSNTSYDAFLVAYNINQITSSNCCTPLTYTCATTTISAVTTDGCTYTAPDLISVHNLQVSCSQYLLTQLPNAGSALTPGSHIIQILDNTNTIICSYPISVPLPQGQLSNCPTDNNLIVNASHQVLQPDYLSQVSYTSTCANTSFELFQMPSAGSMLYGLQPTETSIYLTFNGQIIDRCSFTTQKIDTLAPQFACPLDQTYYLTNSCSLQVTLPQLTAMSESNGCIVGDLSNYTLLGTFQGHSYYKSNFSANYLEALNFSAQLGGHVLVLSTLSESSFLNVTTPTWIGLDDIDNENIFTWAFQTPLQVSNWQGIAEPNNIGLDGSSSADAAVILPLPGLPWADESIFALHPFVIEFDCEQGTYSPPIMQSSGPSTMASLTQGDYSVSYAAFDLAGNMATCGYDIAVVDTISPVINCPTSPLSVNLNSSCSALVPNVINQITITDNCPNGITITQSPIAGSPIPSAQGFLIYITAMDIAGNDAFCVVQVNGQDVSNPQFVCPPTQNLPLGANCQALLPDYRNLVIPSDNCSNATQINIVQTPAPNTIVSEVGSIQVQFTVTDASGNNAICSMLVNKVDNTGPVLTCPTPSAIYLDASCQAIMPDLRLQVTAIDNCSPSGNISLIQSPPPGTPLNGVGPIAVSISAADAFNNVSTCSFVVQKLDSIGPQFVCPSNATLPLGANCSAQLPDYRNQIVFTDVCHTAANIQLLQQPLQGSVISGIQPVEILITAIDPYGNQSECIFIVTPIDVLSPSVTCPLNGIPLLLDAACTSEIPDLSNLILIEDGCSIGGSFDITQVPQPGSPIAGLTPLGITFYVTDEFNNSSSCTSIIQPIDITAPNISCLSTQFLSLNDDCAAVMPDYLAMITAQDGCSAMNEMTFVQNPPAGFLINGHDTTTVTIQIIDSFDNTSTCSFDVISTDNQSPTIACLENQTAPIATNCAFIVPDFTDQVSVSDNCTSVANLIISQTPSPGTEINGSQTIVYLIATDEANNTTECSFELVAADDIIPTISCPSNIQEVFLNADCNFEIPNLIPLVQVSDNCSTSEDFIMVQNPMAGSLIYQAGTWPISLSVTDAANNTNTCFVEISVVDTSEFELLCPADQIVVLDDQCQFTLPNYSVQVEVNEPCTNGNTYTWDQWPPVGDMLVGETDALITMILQSPAHGLTSCSFHILTQADPSIYIQCPLSDTLHLTSACSSTLPQYAQEVILNNECTNSTLWQITQLPEAGSQVLSGQIVQLQITYLDEITQCAFPITLIDTIAPTLNCPEQWEVLSTSDCEYLIPTLFDPLTVTDNCSTIQELTWTQSPSPGSVIDANQLAEIIVTDAYGNTSQCAIDVIISTLETSSMACPSEIVLMVDQDCNYMVPEASDLATITAPCAEIIEWSQNPSPNSIWSGENTEIEISALLSNGSILTCASVVQLPANEIQLICPNAIEQQITCDSLFDDFTDLIIVTAGCPTEINYDLDQYPIVGSGLGDMPAQMIFETTTTDGISLQCEVSILYIDNNSTYFIECPDTIQIPLSTNCDYSVPEILGFVMDDCGQTLDTLWNTTALTGTIISVNAHEDFILQSNTNDQFTCTVAIDYVVEPISPPCPSDTIIYSTEEFITLENYIPISSGINCLNQSWSITQSPQEGTNIAIPTEITITYSGPEITETGCTFLITPVLLGDPFTANCPDSLFVPIINNCEISGQQVNALINTIPVFSSSPYSWTALPVESNYTGITNLIFQVTNTDGNIFGCEIQVIAQDITPPLVTATQMSIDLFVNEACVYILPDLSNYLLVQENCSYNLTQTPNAGIALTNDTTVTLVVSDGAGHSQSVNIQVLLISPQPALLQQLPDVLLTASPLSCAAFYDWTTLIEIPANCSNYELQSDALDQTEFPVGTHIVAYYAIDEMGESTDTLTFTIDVLDEIPPTIMPLTNDQIILCTTDAVWEMPIIFDCSAYTYELNYDPIQLGNNVVQLQATDEHGFSSSYTFHIIVPSMTWNDANIPMQVCQNSDSLQLPEQTADALVWYIDNNVGGYYLHPQTLSTGWHQLLAEATLDGCSIDTIWNIEVLPSPETINLDTAYNICGASFDIAWTSNATEIQWVLPSDVLLDSTTDSLLFALNTFGVHPIQVITSIGMCSATFDFTIYNDAPIDTIEAGPDQHIAYGLTASLFGLTNATEVIWTTNDALDFSSPNEQISLATASQNGTYDLYFTATNGSCVASDSLQLIFEGGQLPNTITPNGDGINDTFDVGGSTAQVIKLKIVNRWGQLVYENSNYQNDWTGTTTDGQSLPNDTYFYEINVVNQNLTGFIQIKR